MPVKLILEYTYRLHGERDALASLHDFARSGADAIVCRIRSSEDHVLFVHPDTTLDRLCGLEERVDELRFCEIDAMMRLNGYRILTLEALLDGYTGEVPLVLHFRGVRPDGNTVSRVMRDPRFSFATDSVEQLTLIAQAYPDGKTVGFASHIPNGLSMARAGASAVCLYGRESSAYTDPLVDEIRVHSDLWIAPPGRPKGNLDTEKTKIRALGAVGIVVPLDYME